MSVPSLLLPWTQKSGPQHRTLFFLPRVKNQSVSFSGSQHSEVPAFPSLNQETQESGLPAFPASSLTDSGRHLGFQVWVPQTKGPSPQPPFILGSKRAGAQLIFLRNSASSPPALHLPSFLGPEYRDPSPSPLLHHRRGRFPGLGPPRRKCDFPKATPTFPQKTRLRPSDWSTLAPAGLVPA